MTTTHDDFKRWFVGPIQTLKSDPHAAFALLMVVFPLLERYLREKSGIREGSLNAAFYDEFHRIFGVLPRALVEKLWQCYRNGLLHQATFSLQSRSGLVMPSSFLTSETQLIDYDATDDVFYVNPITFADVVIREIESNFAVFEGSSSRNHPLPEVFDNLSSHLTPDGPSATGVI